MVFQTYALYPHLTVYDNIAFSLRLRKHDKGEIDRRVREAAQVLGLGPEHLEDATLVRCGSRELRRSCVRS
jgi:ABC-type sugar transport system ATPase subunit